MSEQLEKANRLKVVLIRPPYVIPKTSVFGQRGTPSLSLAYLSALVKEMGHESYCIDSYTRNMDQFKPIDDLPLYVNGLDNTEIVDLIPKNADVIGISCMFSSEWINTSRLIKLIKRKFPNTILILGGEHVTADNEYILKKYPEVDCCILGEGEEKLRSLLNAIQEDRDNYKSAGGITYYDPNTKSVKTNPSNYRIKDIDTLPVPDWTGLGVEEFHKRNLSMSMLGKITMPMLLSRGCPYQCTFCSSPQMWTTRWTSRNIDLVIDEIKSHIKKYNVDHIDFYDLTAIVNKQWTIDFCKRLIKEDLKISWSLPSGTRSEALTKEVLELLYQSGCTKITYAPETGSKRVNDLIKKKVNLKKMLRSMRDAVEAGLIVKANIIFGFPGENAWDRFLNFVLLTRMAIIGIHDVPCFGFSPYPGSELFEKLEKEGKITRGEGYYVFLSGLVYTKPINNQAWGDGIRDNMIPFLSMGGMSYFYGLQFLLRPIRIYRSLRNIRKKTFQTIFEIAISNMIHDFVKKNRFNSKKSSQA